jgi:hypothetical protein
MMNKPRVKKYGPFWTVLMPSYMPIVKGKSSGYYVHSQHREWTTALDVANAIATMPKTSTHIHYGTKDNDENLTKMVH